MSWYGEASLPTGIVLLLRAATRVYLLALRLDQAISRRRQRHLRAYTISVGNLVVGGTGKTPFVLWLANLLQEQGLRPAILTRGYKRAGKGPALVPTDIGTPSGARLFGDEPLMLAQAAPQVPVWVGQDRRSSGARAILESAADTIILDDGFQHLALGRDLDLVLLDTLNPFGNGLTLPAGPLREPVSHLSRADAILLTRARDPERLLMVREQLAHIVPDIPVFACSHRIVSFRKGLRGNAVSADQIAGSRIAAFAGIAHPDAFFNSLEELGLQVVYSARFPDHHSFENRDIEDVSRIASSLEAEFLVTTEKDAIRLIEPHWPPLLVAILELDFGPDLERLRRWIESTVPSR